MSTKRSEGMIRRTKKTNDSKKKFVVEQLLLLHNWVVASIGDLKLLALFGVLVLKSFFLPMNITLSLLKLGFITPSWPEPSLSDDLEKVEIRNIFCHDELWKRFWAGFNGKYVERDVHLWMVFIFLSIKQPAHCVIKHHTVSITDFSPLLCHHTKPKHVT